MGLIIGLQKRFLFTKILASSFFSYSNLLSFFSSFLSSFSLFSPFFSFCKFEKKLNFSWLFYSSCLVSLTYLASSSFPASVNLPRCSLPSSSGSSDCLPTPSAVATGNLLLALIIFLSVFSSVVHEFF